MGPTFFTTQGENVTNVYLYSKFMIRKWPKRAWILILFHVRFTSNDTSSLGYNVSSTIRTPFLCPPWCMFTHVLCDYPVASYMKIKAIKKPRYIYLPSNFLYNWIQQSNKLRLHIDTWCKLKDHWYAMNDESWHGNQHNFTLNQQASNGARFTVTLVMLWWCKIMLLVQFC